MPALRCHVFEAAVILRQQLVAIRENARATVAAVEAILSAMEEPTDGSCDHGPDKRLEAAAMGKPGAWVCQCGNARGDD